MSKDEPVDAQMVWAGLGPARQAGVFGVHPSSVQMPPSCCRRRWIKLDRDRWEAESSSAARCQLSISLVLGIEHGEAEREAAARRPDYIQLASQGDARPWPLVLPLLVYWHRQDGKTCSCPLQQGKLDGARRNTDSNPAAQIDIFDVLDYRWMEASGEADLATVADPVLTAPRRALRKVPEEPLGISTDYSRLNTSNVPSARDCEEHRCGTNSTGTSGIQFALPGEQRRLRLGVAGFRRSLEPKLVSIIAGECSVLCEPVRVTSETRRKTLHAACSPPNGLQPSVWVMVQHVLLYLPAHRQGRQQASIACASVLAFKPNSWARKLWVAPAAKMPLRLSPDEQLRAQHRHAQRPPQLDAQDPCRFFGVGFSEWQNQSRSRIGSGGEGRTGQAIMLA
ncbi:hypothetical protein TRIATDRAFT_273198 [Trichoderma atroviride IMI 206040]|uniref:Uncharacterized protein n=1 Tax=Hypocrea atroviridis (strain ATCC 20476 / IMI 206040) TaxID=452589 RepID=G9NSC1_HYPAI|nr:uncharacterized protein TRIATDRAFT_273198 [Trichoderma atroviride IMI 206040]EHK46322.1 hypothetical protein TRIATDRAFT_273198 [Trichoderma atroviride IMI 206040]